MVVLIHYNMDQNFFRILEPVIIVALFKLYRNEKAVFSETRHFSKYLIFRAKNSRFFGFPFFSQKFFSAILKVIQESEWANFFFKDMKSYQA